VSVKGEFWLIDGEAIFADGEFNHESYAWQHLLSELADALEPHPKFRVLHKVIRGWAENDGGDPAALRELVCDSADLLQKRGLWTREETDDAYEFIRATIGWPPEKLRILTSSNGREIDVRVWAQEHWGWIRVHDRACEFWQLSERKLKELAQGLYAAYHEAAEESTFILEVLHPQRRHFLDVPFAEIEKGRLTALLPYR
jgi:hypothetical protein